MKTVTSTPKFHSLAVLTALGAFALAGCGDNPETDTNVPGESVEMDGGDEPDAAEADGSDQAGTRDARQDPMATAELADPAGEARGQVEFYNLDGGETEVVITAENLEAGFYGFHIHEIGECEPDSAAPDDSEDTGDFKSAGGHIAGEEDADHPDHAGDLPTLLVNNDGTANMSVVTARLDESTLLDDDGSAVIIHSDPDNFSNVPERYLDDATPDEDTVATGDAGDRIVCGVIE